MAKTARLLVGLLLLLLPIAGVAQSRFGAQIGDAFVVTDGDGRSGTWIIGNRRVAFTLQLDPRGGFRVVSLSTPEDDRVWDLGGAPDAVVTIHGRPLPIGDPNYGWEIADVRASDDGVGVFLEVAFENRREQLVATRVYRCYPGTPVIETWTRFASPADGAALRLDNLNVWHLSIPGREVQWLTGLVTPEDVGGPFTQMRQRIDEGASLEIGAHGRSSESAVPWFSIREDGGQLFGGLLWSGAWSLRFDGAASGVRAALGLRDMSTPLEPGREIETPHGFFGATPGTGMTVSAAMRAFIDRVRGGRPFTPLVTYNTWFVDFTDINQEDMLDRIDRASELGVELFVLDAGWYAGAGTFGLFDFTSGLGTWEADEARFPDGLALLAARAHELGMRFGLWVEPERVALDTVGQPGLAVEAWLATRDGRYDPGVEAGQETSAQICLRHPDAWNWTFTQLVRVIETVQPDYVKWDNNFWINCNRPDHGHTTQDGNFAHVQALYELLGALRERYPWLLIENVSGGGHRLDFGMLRYSDTGWMDDRSAPSLRVRHSAEGLSTVFPPSYLLSFVMDSPDEEMNAEADLPLYFRSRMAGVLGISFDTGVLEEGQANEVASELALYKGFRDLQRAGHAVLLTDQAASVGGPPWDVVQIVTDLGDAVMLAFQNDEGVDRILVHPVGLQRHATYQIWSADQGILDTRTGAQLMEEGLTIERTSRSAAQVFRLTPLVESARAPRGRR